MTSEEFKAIATTIPHQPGIYKYFDAKNTIIYVGKAKDLHKRVRSYFNKNLASYKTQELVKQIQNIEFTIVDSEQDAFFLENALIKAHQPRYNIDLKDDKTYPYIAIKKEPFPRVFLTRTKINDGSEYIGPFTSVARVREILSFVKQHIQLRTCKLHLSEKNIASGKFKVCLEYHLGNCKGPCVAYQTAANYAQGIAQLKQIMKGNLTQVTVHYKELMQEHIKNLQFEQAELVKKKLEHLEAYKSRSVIVSNQIGDVDIFTILRDDEIAYINYLMVREGTIIQTHSQKLKPKLDENDAEVLGFGIMYLREQFASSAQEIVLSQAINYPIDGITITVPKAGDKKKLLELSEKNVQLFLQEIKRKKMLHLEDKTSDERFKVLEEIQKLLSLPNIPEHIECFDNSNFQGSYPVSAMVCFKNGVPNKEDYRKFNVKTVEGINDFASMAEAVGRRYKRLESEGLPFPQLVIIDGGKGQLSAAVGAMEELGLIGKTTFVGLAKNIEEVFFTGDKESLKLPYNSASLKLIRRIRDEVHRFGINFHRQQRSKGTFKNELEDIVGIGEATANQLLKKFRSVNKVKNSTAAEIAAVVGTAKAKLIIDHFN